MKCSQMKNIRIRMVLWVRKTGITAWVKSLFALILSALSKARFQPKAIPNETQVLIVSAYYDHPNWVQGMVQSILSQSFTQWTLVLVNDCSPGEDLRILLKEELKDPRIRIVEMTKNEGAYVARNKGIDWATDTLNWTHVTFIDPDDEAYPSWLRHLLEKLGDEEGAVQTLLERWDEHFSKMKSIYHGHCTTLWSRNIWEKLGGFEAVRVSGDSELLMRAKILLQGEFQIQRAHLAGQRCRLHGGNASKTGLLNRKIWMEERKKQLKKF